MGLALGNLLGAYTKFTTPGNTQQSLQEFYNTFKQYGIQIKSRYEVNFSGVTSLNFFISSIQLPGKHMNYTQIPFGGKQVDIPINYEYDHNLSFTVINDASGYIYNNILNYFASEGSGSFIEEGFTVTVKAIGDDYTPGQVITLNKVRFKDITGLTFGQSDNAVSTFQLNCTVVDWSAAKGENAEFMGALGAIKSLMSTGIF